MEEIQYNDYRKMIYKVAYTFKNSGVPIEDLIAVGNLSFSKIMTKYNRKKKAKFSTFLYVSIKNAMINYIKSENKHSLNISLDEIMEIYDSDNDITGFEPLKNKVTPEISILLIDLIKNTSKDFRKILLTIIKNPDDIMHLTKYNSSKYLICAIKKLMKNRNFSEKQINIFIKESRRNFKSIFLNT